MKRLVIALGVLVGATGCGGKRSVGASGPGAVATVFPAARWVPDNPTYVFSARTMRDAQKAFRDVADTFGLAIGADATQFSAAAQMVLGVDVFSAEAVSGIGVDLDGNVAMFSDDVNPTFVVHLSGPEALQAFFDGQRQKGMATQSVMVEGIEVFTAKLASEAHVSWAIDKDWLWIHFTVGSGPDDIAWFTSSRQPRGASWVGKWEAAQKLSTKAAGLIGFIALRELFGKIAAKQPEVVACAKQFDNVRGVGVVIEGEGNYVAGKLAVDLASTQTIAQSTLAPPPGWATASARAPLAGQWNLDLRTLATWVQPCIAKVDGQGNTIGGAPNLVAILDEFGIRTGRAYVHKLDPDDKEGVGVIALDLSHRQYIAAQLDQIPMRSKFERSRNFGAYKGKHLSVPFVATVDYVLDDRVFMLAMGDGQLERAASGAPQGAPPVFAIDLLPPGLPLDVWVWLLTEAEVPQPKRVAQRLQTWNDIHLGARLDGDRLVIEAQGNRR